MNLGQYLTQYSPLPSGTVAQHLTAIAGRIGTGQGTVFCSQFVVVMEQPDLVVTRRVKRRASPEPLQAPRTPVTDDKQKAVTAFRFAPHLAVFSAGPEEVTVRQRTATITVANRLDTKTITQGA